MTNSEILNRNFYFILQADKYVHSDQFKDYSELQNANRAIVANHTEIQEDFLLDMTDCLRNFYKKYSKGCFWNDIAFKIYEKMKTDGIDGDDETLYYKQLNLNPLYDIYKPNCRWTMRGDIFQFPEWLLWTKKWSIRVKSI